ncbi:MAG: tRNA lysidine(34) synthetase TilS [Phycisphaerales bacterium]|nr:tRNA lysidine(34) synthetase TilS [Phycisphaerales bacterium]
MNTTGAIKLPGPRDPFVRRVRAGWRSLTGGSDIRDSERATLIACSGGADSAALVLALADRSPTVAHVVHDWRPREQALADRDATRALAEALDLSFVERQVVVRGEVGNLEAVARRERYWALCQMAVERGLRFVATAHHADDQLETLLLRLCRGAGVHGMRGIAPRRSMGAVEIIRPALGVRRRECEEFCARCGFAWRVDATNEDATLARAALRLRVLPALLEIEPRAAENAERVARQMRRAASHLHDEAAALLETAAQGEGVLTWERNRLRASHEWVLGQALRLAALRVSGQRGSDRRGARAVGACVRGIRDHAGGQRVFEWGGVRVIVERERVSMKGVGDVR